MLILRGYFFDKSVIRSQKQLFFTKTSVIFFFFQSEDKTFFSLMEQLKISNVYI